jgi:hypothetical protein
MRPATFWGNRILWFIALWCLGVLVTGAVAFAIKLWLSAS